MSWCSRRGLRRLRAGEGLAARCHRARSCPAGWAIADLQLRPPEEVKINVFNATDKPNLANAVASDFGNRKFKVQKKGNDKKAVESVAVLRFGPKSVGSAHLLKAYFLNEASRSTTRRAPTTSSTS